MVNTLFLKTALGIEFQSYPPTWITIVVFVCLFFAWLGILQNPSFFRFKSKQMLRTNDRASFFDEGFRALNKTMFLFAMSAVFSSAIFISLSASGNQYPEISFFFIVLFAYLGYHLVKILIFKIILGTIFLSSAKTKMVLDSYLYLNVLLGLAFLPLNVAFLYLNVGAPNIVFITIGLIIAILYYISLITRLIFIFSGNFASIFYLIIYLCTLEIMPILLVVKMQ